ncbi:uncharacterized protein I303_102947 [Kwoniella dejecticola CBS 10117]|uniref:Exonuclease 1 n=1 Tax=Kwoniella dejecticola CBS 10117 TaxID=1296121 RepID=A0AAJ8MEG1_9TREE
MGITGLVSWVKKVHPEAIVHFPNRWASPHFTGKKVAIDATLMTNRYHFASRDGPFKGKGELIGWYNLISEMRAFGVQPIAIWDERGTREWKAPEALKRLTTRANHLARKNHENDRLVRLESLREVFKEFEAMPSEEKDIIRAHWETTRFMFMRPEETTTSEWDVEGIEQPIRHEEQFDQPLPTPPSTPSQSPHIPAACSSPESDATSPSSKKTTPSKSTFTQTSETEAEPKTQTPTPLPTPPPTPPLPLGVAGPSKAAQLTSTLSEADSEVIDRVVGMIDSLAPLIHEYRESQRGGSGAKKDEEACLTFGMEGGIVEMEEEIREWISTKKTTTPTTTAVTAQGSDSGTQEADKDREEKLEELDSALERLLPLTRISETPRQMALSREEGRIISDILSTPPSPPFKSTREVQSESVSQAAPSSLLGATSEVEAEAEAYPTPPSTPEPEAVPVSALEAMEEEAPSTLHEADPMQRLDVLIKYDLPNVKSIYERALDIPSAAEHEDCKALLKVMGVPVLEAKIPYEAEGLAAALAKAGLVDYVATEDSDVLAYDGPLLKNISPITSTLSLISGQSLREKLDLTPSAYLDFLILLGTDASPRIPSIGPVNALRLIKTHGSIEDILANEPKILKKLEDASPPTSKEKFLELVGNARKVFLELPPTEHFHLKGSVELEQGEWNEAEVERYLEERHGIKLVEGDGREREAEYA